jgi:L-asparaginase II
MVRQHEDERAVSAGAVPMAGLWRGDRLESLHSGHAVICDASGAIMEQWGNPQAVIYPRSSCKMVQALPLLESGAGAGLSGPQLALACASHQGAGLHVAAVEKWLTEMGLSERDLRCGAHEPSDLEERNRLIRASESPCQLHNNCSGKHAGFVMLNRHLGGSADYVEADHPVQRAVRATFEEVTGEDSPGYGIDGCSAPNFATSVAGLARAMAAFAVADGSSARGRAMVRLREAMATHPEMVAGEGRACTELMQAMSGVAIKTGAEAVFVAILPKQRLGIALKIVDGGTRAAEAAIVALLARAGALDAAHPAAQKRLGAPLRNWRGLEVGQMRLAPGFCSA